jgi:hypothetical protein
MIGVGKSEHHADQAVSHNAYASQDRQGKSIEYI